MPRDLPTQMHPPLLDIEMIILFANTLKASYYEHVMGSSAQRFPNAMWCEPLEHAVKQPTRQDTNSQKAK
jgi:hypothetical protein